MTSYVAQASHKHAIFPTQPPKDWDYKFEPPCLVSKVNSKKNNLVGENPAYNLERWLCSSRELKFGFNIHIMSLTISYNSSSIESSTLSWPLYALGMHLAYTYMQVFIHTRAVFF